MQQFVTQLKKKATKRWRLIFKNRLLQWMTKLQIEKMTTTLESCSRWHLDPDEKFLILSLALFKRTQQFHCLRLNDPDRSQSKLKAHLHKQCGSGVFVEWCNYNIKILSFIMSTGGTDNWQECIVLHCFLATLVWEHNFRVNFKAIHIFVYFEKRRIETR